MPSEREARILPFVPVDNDKLDQEIVDRERAEALAKMADDALIKLEWERFDNGDVDL